MKKNHLSMFSLIFLLASVALIFVGPATNRYYISMIGILFSFFGVFLLAGSIGYKRYWKCERCGEKVSIGIWTYLISTNGRSRQKRLFCSKCNKKTWCLSLPNQ